MNRRGFEMDLLNFRFCNLHPASVPAQEQPLGLPVVSATEELPPTPYTLHSQLGSVVTHTHVDEALVTFAVVGTVRNRRSDPELCVVVYVDLAGPALRKPGFPSV